MEPQQLIHTPDSAAALAAEVERAAPDRVFVLTDETTRRLCLPRLAHLPCLEGAPVIAIGAGDEHKTLESLTAVWTALQQGGATRHSLLVNVGGGMVTDLGGFAASTFKRGLRFINLPTTLLAMVDASVGGKTGINFGGLKNEVGVFRNATTVIIDPGFLRTLDVHNLLSGYAEMLKHGLISDTAHWQRLLAFEPMATDAPDYYASLGQMVAESVAVKQRVVTADPEERGLRKALNLGHTVGHALESFALRRGYPVLHGYAVAWGLVCELYLSCVKTHFPTPLMRQAVAYINEHYGRMDFTCDDYPELLELMTHDKKNRGSSISFSLLADIGQLRLDETASKDDITEALDFYREGQ